MPMLVRKGSLTCPNGQFLKRYLFESGNQRAPFHPANFSAVRVPRPIGILTGQRGEILAGLNTLIKFLCLRLAACTASAERFPGGTTGCDVSGRDRSLRYFFELSL